MSWARTTGRGLQRLTDAILIVSVVGQFGATFATSRVKSLALDNGLSETADGDLIRFAPDGHPGYVMRRFEEPGGKSPPTYMTGLTFALDVPQVADAPDAR